MSLPKDIHDNEPEAGYQEDGPQNMTAYQAYPLYNPDTGREAGQAP
jgi:hypothetical protein